MQFGLCIIQNALLGDLTRRKRKLEIRVVYGQKKSRLLAGQLLSI